MPTVKYYQSIETAQKAEAGKEPSPHFDLADLGSGGFIGKVLSSHRFWAFMRTWWPIVRIGRFGLVSRYDDVVEVRKRDDVFEAPFKLEMTELAGGANFVLGMRGGPEHARQIRHIMGAIRKSDIEQIIVPVCESVGNRLIACSGDKIDAVQDLLMRVSSEACIAYFGLDVEEPQDFADWVMSLSTLLFADPFGDPTARRLALTGAKNVRLTIQRSIEQARRGGVSADTLVARLVETQRNEIDGPSDAEIIAMLMGLAVGFIPTNTLASGHILEVLFDVPEAMRQATAAARAGDDAKLERCLMEAMRFKPPIIPGLPRYALQDVVLAKGTGRQTRIPKGTTVIAATMSAMLDPRRVRKAKKFDPERSQTGDVLFGGVEFLHYCLGEHVARAQITQAFKPLLRQNKLARAKGKAGKMVKVGPFPRHLQVTFEPAAGHRTSSMITICVPITSPVPAAAVGREIARMGNPAGDAMRRALDATRRLHFASIAAIGGDEKKGEPAYVVVELSVDGPEGSAIDAIAEQAGTLLMPTFTLACGITERDKLRAALHKHVIQLQTRPWDPSGLNFCGTPELPVTQIERDQEIAAAAGAELDGWLGHHAQYGTMAMSALRHVRQQLRKKKMVWALVQPAAIEPAVARRTDVGTWPAIKSLLTERGLLVKLAIAALLAGAAHFVLVHDIDELLDWSGLDAQEGAAQLVALLWHLAGSLVRGALWLAAVAVVLVGALVWIFRRQESRDVSQDFDPPREHVEALLKLENPPGYIQNHITAVTPLKPGWVRKVTLALAFWGIKKLVQHRFRPGFVLDIGTIHYARWFRLPKTSKLIFFSNYDGSWESYLEDFITKAHYGQTAVWSNGIGYPKTRFLLLDGADDGGRFKRWVRRQQVPTRFWYTRFPLLTTDQIRNNALIAHGLANAHSDSQARAWISLFNSQPRPADALETEEIQSLVFGGLGKLVCGELLVLRFPEDAAQCKAWLRDVMSVPSAEAARMAAAASDEGAHIKVAAAPRITFGSVLPEKDAVILALSSPGLKRLGLDKMGVGTPDALGSFPEAFADGMATGNRARILGDADASAPGSWRWGRPGAVPDAVVLLLAKDQQLLDEARAREHASLAKQGVVVLHTIALQDLPEKVARPLIEPFGFRDGISQPIIKGTNRHSAETNPIHAVAPGEFVLGYRDNRGYFPPTPVIAAEHDVACRLASLPDDLPDRFPRFPHEYTETARDFGRNGSFLVIRQLEQNAEGFQKFVAEAVADLEKRYEGLDVTPAWLAAKMLGRWSDGSSLTQHPDRPGGTPDNDFQLGADDPQGLRCPYGAHIRRANPRDSSSPGSQEQLDISNRHRILRVGRPYVEGADGTSKGLVFMCLNADIERQFEFVQQTWLNASSFHGLRSEVDPIAATSQPGASGTFTIPMPAGPIEVRDVKSYVTVRGGGYFFLPSRSVLRFLSGPE